nr:MAG TPA: hypothetical protein [Caudoviricetes sp.]
MLGWDYVARVTKLVWICVWVWSGAREGAGRGNHLTHRILGPRFDK